MCYIAHFRKTDLGIHELKDHLICVSEKCEQYGTPIGLGKFSKLSGMLHDMGKYGDEFQDYIKQKMRLAMQGVNESKEDSYQTIDHGKIGAMYIYNIYHDSKNAVEKVTAEILSMVICSHHGGLRDYISMDLGIPLLERFRKEQDQTNYIQCVTRFLDDVYPEDAIKGLFKESCDEIRLIMQKLKINKMDILFSLHLVIKQVFSILIDCDRYDTYLFMEGKCEEKPIDTALLWESYAKRIEEEITNLKSKDVPTAFEKKIIDLRMQISDLCYGFAQKNRGVYTLTVPTGGGKTLSSLRFALNHAATVKMERIIYVLPYTTIIEQNADVVRKALQCDEYLLEHHSNVIHTEDEHYKLLTQRWDSPIIFTTMVQFLNTFFEDKTSSIRRLHHLNNSVLIFDEIQTIPIKCISLFNETINFLSSMCECTVILSSATQPGLENTKRSIRKASDHEIIKDTTYFFKNFKRMNVIPKLISSGYTAEMLKDFILRLKTDAKSILIILNTKQAVEDTYNALCTSLEENKEQVYLLSTNLCPAHRKNIIKEIKTKLKDGQDVICVSTQLIEAGVDISFEIVVRSLAGLDSIAQASGRGNRHGEGDIKETYIVNMQNESLKHLQDIALGQKHTHIVLDEYKRNPDRFQDDLLSPEAIHEYFSYYYQEQDKHMDYWVDKLRENLYRLLSSNENKKKAYFDQKRDVYPLELTYMFETAAKNFNVIDDATRTVLVPYEGGKRVIAELLSSKSLKEKLAFLKEAQQYSVNLFEHQFERLNRAEALVNSTIEGVNILKEGHYNKVLGVVEEKEMEFLVR